MAPSGLRWPKDQVTADLVQACRNCHGPGYQVECIGSQPRHFAESQTAVRGQEDGRSIPITNRISKGCDLVMVEDSHFCSPESREVHTNGRVARDQHVIRSSFERP